VNNQEIAAVVEAIEDELAQSAIGLSSVGLHAQFQGIRTGRMTDDSGSSRTEAIGWWMDGSELMAFWEVL
jgi:hypothetical protein